MHYFIKQKHFSHILEDFFFNLVLLCGKRYGNTRAYTLLAGMRWVGQLSGQLNKMVQPLQKKIWLFLIKRVIVQSSNSTPSIYPTESMLLLSFSRWTVSDSFCDPMDCSPPGSSVHEITQATIPEWAGVPFSRASSWPRDWTCIARIGRWILYYWATWEAPTESMGLHKNIWMFSAALFNKSQELEAS